MFQVKIMVQICEDHHGADGRTYDADDSDDDADDGDSGDDNDMLSSDDNDM